MKLVTAALLLILSANVFAQTKGALENPSQGSYTSGIYMFSGWACDADLIEVVINGGSGQKAAYGTDRGDTAGICGDSDNGFGLLFNMANLGTGTHTAVAFADGQEFGRSTFKVERMSTGEFLRGEQGFSIDVNFPREGREVWLEWVESAQNFMITKEMDTPDPLDISGGWYSDAVDAGSVISTYRRYADREELMLMLAYDGGWEVYAGYLQGTRAEVQTFDIFGPKVDASIDFSDTTTGVITINSCTSANGYICAFRPGAKIAIRKILGNPGGASTGLAEAPN
ncbi:hypothetical protein N9C39_04775 [Luminiphilus sp.]|nr:hypothetical protein [Luminiphilus sp.]